MESRKYPRYMFDVDFDAQKLPREPEIVDEEPPPPTFSIAEMEAAKQEAHEAGKADGIAQSNAGFEHQINETLNTLQQNFAALVAAQNEANDATMRDAVQVAATIVRKLLPDYTERHGLDEIEAFVKATLSSLFAEAEVVVRIPDAMADAIAGRLEPIAMATGLGDKLKVVPDAGMGPADCRLDWGDGGAERNGERLLAAIDTIVARFLEHGDTVSGEPDAPERMSGPTEREPEAEMAETGDTTVKPDPDLTMSEPDPAPHDTAQEEAPEAPFAASADEPEPEEAGQETDLSGSDDPPEETADVHPPAAAEPQPAPETSATAAEQPAAAPVLPGAIDVEAPERSN